VRQEDIAEAVGSALLDARRQAGLTQVELSALSGIDPAAISRYELGVGMPKVVNLLRLERALGIGDGVTIQHPAVKAAVDLWLGDK